MFGEEEIFNPRPRSFYAIARHPNTFLYTLKKKVKVYSSQFEIIVENRFILMYLKRIMLTLLMCLKTG